MTEKYSAHFSLALSKLIFDIGVGWFETSYFFIRNAMILEKFVHADLFDSSRSTDFRCRCEMYERKVRIAFFYRTFCASFTLTHIHTHTHTHTSGILKRRKERMERKVERIGNDKMNEDGHWENFLHSLRSDGIYIYEEKNWKQNEMNARTIVGKKVFALVMK